MLDLNTVAPFIVAVIAPICSLIGVIYSETNKRRRLEADIKIYQFLKEEELGPNTIPLHISFSEHIARDSFSISNIGGNWRDLPKGLGLIAISMTCLLLITYVIAGMQEGIFKNLFGLPLIIALIAISATALFFGTKRLIRYQSMMNYLSLIGKELSDSSDAIEEVEQVLKLKTDEHETSCRALERACTVIKRYSIEWKPEAAQQYFILNPARLKDLCVSANEYFKKSNTELESLIEETDNIEEITKAAEKDVKYVSDRVFRKRNVNQWQRNIDSLYESCKTSKLKLKEYESLNSANIRILESYIIELDMLSKKEEYRHQFYFEESRFLFVGDRRHCRDNNMKEVINKIENGTYFLTKAAEPNNAFILIRPAEEKQGGIVIGFLYLKSQDENYGYSTSND